MVTGRHAARLGAGGQGRRSGMRALMAGIVTTFAWCVVAAITPAAASSEAAAGSSAEWLSGRIFTVAGSSWPGSSSERALATGRTLDRISAVAAMPRGGLVISVDHDSRVWRVWPGGRITVAAGDGRDGFSGDGGPATRARLSGPEGVAALSTGGFLIADFDNDRVRRVWPDGHISTVAGDSDYGDSGDGGPATAASLDDPVGVATLADGGFVVTDSDDQKVRRVWPDGHISTAATEDQPWGLAALPDGSFLISDIGNGWVRRVWPDGHTATVAGPGTGEVFSGDGGPATAANIGQPQGVAAMPDGGFVIAADNNRPATANDYPFGIDFYSTSELRRVWPDGHISTLAGNSSDPVVFGDGGPANAASLGFPSGVAVTPDGSVLISTDSTVRLVVGPHGTSLLAAAVRPLTGSVLRRGYKLSLVLTKPASMAFGLYRAGRSMPVVVAHAARQAGQTTFVMRSRHMPSPGLYAIDVHAQAGTQSARAAGWVYLGGQLTKPFVRSLQYATVSAAADFSLTNRAVAHTAEQEPEYRDRICHQFSRTRVDCRWTADGSCAWVSASFLTARGQVYTRRYSCPRRRKADVFTRYPRWRSRRAWEDLSAVWP